MNAKYHIKISQFIDNELEAQEALELLQTLQQQAELMATKNRYEAVRGVLKNQEFVSVTAGFAQRIQQEINQEQRYVAPKLNFKPKSKAAFKPMWLGQGLVALAASIAVVAIIAERNMNGLPNISQAVIAQQTPQPIIRANLEKTSPLNTRINDYIQAHNNSGYANGEPFAAPASFNSVNKE